MSERTVEDALKHATNLKESETPYPFESDAVTVTDLVLLADEIKRLRARRILMEPAPPQSVPMADERIITGSAMSFSIVDADDPRLKK